MFGNMVMRDIKRRASMAGQSASSLSLSLSVPQILSLRLLVSHLKYWLRYVYCGVLNYTGIFNSYKWTSIRVMATRTVRF
ncbi:uncharacterized protein G2W53_043221 [Senna tora]|uniref:Uncharacterized protein n=1 Tax=Senna tora TaxID=362788 RepID=A0A834W0G0_9FABA|nr:uncharacterized protein G2W53_043221 [Senna tora]